MLRRARGPLLAACVLALIAVQVHAWHALQLGSRPLRDLLTVDGARQLARDFWELVGPGGKLHPSYFLEHKGHLVIEAVLVVVILSLFLQRSFKPANDRSLTDKEIEQLCKEWEPEPLVPASGDDQHWPEPKVLTAVSGNTATIEGKQVLNLASADYLGLTGNKDINDACRATINKYGVGSCGPRGFYGTIDVHLQLEELLAKFLGTEGAIVYSYDIATVSSVIPAFAQANDILVVDEFCGYPIQMGCQLARSQLHYFKHNDMADLERVLQRVDQQERRARKPLTRRFIIVEGIYANFGDLAPLDKIAQLKEKYKYRLIVDESFSFGVLGATGRGACEHFGLQSSQVDIVCAGLGAAAASVGGFCAGDRDVIEFQRLSGGGYIFSASAPPYLATAATCALQHIISHKADLLPRLRANAAALRAEVRKVPGLALHGASPADDVSPVVLLKLAKPPASAVEADNLLQRVADHMLRSDSVFVSVNRVSALDRLKGAAGSLKLYANANLTPAQIATIGSALRKAAKAVL